nr:hypothetical protein GCM10020093_092470 [Planobispora longispora]
MVTTPLPPAADLVRRVDCGVVVPFGDVDAAVEAVVELRDDPGRAAAMGARGYAEATRGYHWPEQAAGFVGLLEEWAGKTVTSGREIGLLEPWHAI